MWSKPFVLWARISLIAVSVALFVSPARGQELKILDYGLSGEVELGVRQLYGDRDSNKFEEYREIPQGFYLEDFKLDLDKPGRFFEFRGEDVLEDDQFYRLSVGALGWYRLDFTWDQIPHVYNNNARTPYAGAEGTVLTIPDIVQSTLQGSANQPEDLRDFLTGASDVPLEIRRDRGEVQFRYQLNPELTWKLSYANERYDGTKPLGAIFGPNPGPSGRIAEIIEPIDIRVNDIRTSLEYAKDGNAVELAYAGSFFNNRHSSLTFDNPLRLTDEPGQTSRGRYSLDPDNEAHSVSVSGALNLPMRTRFMGTFSYGWLLQDEDFLPHTINSALSGDPSLILPRNSLDGEINPTLINLVLVNKAISNLTIKGRYRYYDLENNSKSITFPGHVLGDTTLSTEARRNLPYQYTRHKAGVDLRLRLSPMLALKGGYEYIDTDRDFYEAAGNTEHKAKVAVDYNAASWLKLQGSYVYSDRDVQDYDAARPILGFPGEEGQGPNLPGLRKYDQNTRKRHEGRILAQIMPVSWMTVTLEGTLADDDYDSPELGLQEDWNYSGSVEVAATPLDWLTVWAGYSHESTHGEMVSQQRVSFLPDDPINKWDSEWTDRNNVVRTGLEAILLREENKDKKVTAGAEFIYSESRGKTETKKRNPASTLVTSAVNYPEIESELIYVNTSIRYYFTKNLSVGVGYSYERFDLDDFTQDHVGVYVADFIDGTDRDFFLGARIESYEAHTVGVFFKLTL